MAFTLDRLSSNRLVFDHTLYQNLILEKNQTIMNLWERYDNIIYIIYERYNFRYHQLFFFFFINFVKSQSYQRINNTYFFNLATIKTVKALYFWGSDKQQPLKKKLALTALLLNTLIIYCTVLSNGFFWPLSNSKNWVCSNACCGISKKKTFFACRQDYVYLST